MMSRLIPAMLVLVLCVACGPRGQATPSTEVPGPRTAAPQRIDGTSGLYGREGVTAVVEREIWPRYLDGELTRDEALLEIVETLEPQPDGS